MRQSRRAFVAAALAMTFVGAPAVRAAPFASRRISVTVRGQGRDILLIPGLASGPATWDGIIRRAPAYRYHLVHVAGFAGAAAGANGDGPVLQPVAAEIARYLDERGLTRCALVGHSMGGMLAMLTALARPRRVDRLMVVDMLPDGAAMLGGTSAGLGYLADQLNGYFTRTKAGRQILADMVRQTPGGRDSDPAVISRSLADMARTDLSARLRQLNVPMSVVYPVLPDPQAARLWAQRYRQAYAGLPHVRLDPVGPAGHLVMQDQPAKFAALLRKFL